MKEELKARFVLLEDAGIISKEVHMYVDEVIDLLIKTYDKDKQSILEMFTTHLAMASQRVLSNAEVESLDDFIWEQVLGSSSYHKAVELCDIIEKMSPCSFPEGERRFLIMHLCNLEK